MQFIELNIILNPLDTLYCFILLVPCEKGTVKEMNVERLFAYSY